MTGWRSKKNGQAFPISQRKGRSEVMEPSAGITHEGALTKHGYNEEEGTEKRHEGLRKAVDQDGYEVTVERVNALAVLNKNNPEKHRKLEQDIAWLEETFRGEK